MIQYVLTDTVRRSNTILWERRLFTSDYCGSAFTVYVPVKSFPHILFLHLNRALAAAFYSRFGVASISGS